MELKYVPYPSAEKFDESAFKNNPHNGYLYIYAGKHRYADSRGMLHKHVYVMCMALDRALAPDECVHHLDRNKHNNSIDNLQLLPKAVHQQLHGLEKRFSETVWVGYREGVFYRVDTGEVLEATDTAARTCSCGKLFKAMSRTQKFCSEPCRVVGNRRFELSKEELERLVWKLPTVKIAKLYGVSDVAIAKRCKRFGIEKPGRGYWAEKASRDLESIQASS